MLRPRDLVGHEYIVRVTTDLGLFERRMIAFDADDARAQVLEYCRTVGLVLLQVAVR